MIVDQLNGQLIDLLGRQLRQPAAGHFKSQVAGKSPDTRQM